ncbi:Uncharacterized protein conserved in bacteria [Bordetella pertussis]|uniref:DUF937 domain-containing protein n=5 Tax=Bordetella pertussis TaxID=520 RepID=Q7VXK8_BORPE|nr:MULTISPECIES: YidB family protein [Bordetella]ETH39725.1 PF06078 family protein [Bordetella pertussis H918]ETH44729.1 PF06078 family protein [Bordetella pertussis H939]ETH48538.1 PF06078 family protein [Bordetella pertussis H921]ETH71286.1 PF06078 family protein [Bordetella pertussis STO1-CHLA-0011]ETH81137.1 PF06078 family protein [Bordetella pertussis STO1-CHOC-0017]ETH87499.1 PF06078 family protein [Bordetella pertussis STO1-CHOC-0018]ETH91253.1 PF06078 family protein [Bordetella pertu
MGLLDSLTSIAGGALGGGDERSANGGMAALLPVLVAQLNNYPGGLTALIQRFQEGGLGEVIASWVSAGPNQPVTPAQLDSVLEPGMVDQMAQQSGQDRGDVLANLSRLLPGLVDTATPGGQAESGQSFDAGSLLASLSGLLDGKRG